MEKGHKDTKERMKEGERDREKERQTIKNKNKVKNSQNSSKTNYENMLFLMYNLCVTYFIAVSFSFLERNSRDTMTLV